MTDLIKDYAKDIFNLITTTAGITEVMINAPDKPIWYMQHGRAYTADFTISATKLTAMMKAFARHSGHELTEKGKDGILQSSFAADDNLFLRLAGLVSPYSAAGGSLCIRRHSPKIFTLDEIAKTGTAHKKNIPNELTHTWDAVQYIRACIQAKRNILISGSTDSGKTTIINAMLHEVPNDIRMLTIEDTLELRAPIPNLIKFQAVETDGVSAALLLKLALRYRPDSIVVGEVRGGEAYQLVEAWGTGHNGGFSSIHANDAAHALLRLQGLALDGSPGQLSELSAKIKIAAAVDNIIFVQKDAESGERRITEIVRLQDKLENGDFLIHSISLKGAQS